MNSGEFTIVLILVVLCATVFFCHALLRLFLLIFRGDRPSRRRLERTTHYLVPGGYAVPEEPIPVVLAQDEEARGTEPEPGKVTPPAYGLWRGSVVSAQTRSGMFCLNCRRGSANRLSCRELTRIDCSGNEMRLQRPARDQRHGLDHDHRHMLQMTECHM
jgi:hypothetical protein